MTTFRSRRLEASYRHGMRVRVGLARDRGILLHCTKRDGGGKYWRIRLQNGEWRWPDETMVVDGPGDIVGTCAQCDLPFLLAAGSGELLCASCHVEQFGEAARSDPPPAKRWNQRRRWRP